MKRQIALDTETTGLKPEDGHKIVEIGAVELIDGVKTGNTFHVYLNPQRIIPEEVIKVHGITNDKVKDSPIFAEVADDFIDFIKDSELLIHNADFDIKFLNSELAYADKGKIWDHVSNAICTLKLAKKLFKSNEDFKNPSLEEEKKSKRVSYKLDSLCESLGVDNSHRVLHGALLDSDLLADVFIAIRKIHSLEDIEADMEQTNWVRPEVKRFANLNFVKAKLSTKEEAEHEKFLDHIEKDFKVQPVFKLGSQKLKM